MKLLCWFLRSVLVWLQVSQFDDWFQICVVSFACVITLCATKPVALWKQAEVLVHIAAATHDAFDGQPGDKMERYHASKDKLKTAIFEQSTGLNLRTKQFVHNCKVPFQSWTANKTCCHGRQTDRKPQFTSSNVEPRVPAANPDTRDKLPRGRRSSATHREINTSLALRRNEGRASISLQTRCRKEGPLGQEGGSIPITVSWDSNLVRRQFGYVASRVTSGLEM